MDHVRNVCEIVWSLPSRVAKHVFATQAPFWGQELLLPSRLRSPGRSRRMERVTSLTVLHVGKWTPEARQP